MVQRAGKEHKMGPPWIHCFGAVVKGTLKWQQEVQKDGDSFIDKLHEKLLDNLIIKVRSVHDVE